ncbi:UNVERIFIED_CONTAM: hypothetical protein Slati_3859400 [Sesamum latifolium]|uniref:Uncharacterized protein n=1 Tax=Sesamum latifolium TaxID=2727402 RepID=A0AAW2TKW2_9LAMI
MAADVLNRFWSKKYWFPSKYFSLYAPFLIFLGLTIVQPVGLITHMNAATDHLAKVSSLVFLLTAMANSFTSLGSMDNENILASITTLCILVIITVTGNSYLSGGLVFDEEILASIAMLVLLVLVCSSALMISSNKRHLRATYRKMHEAAVREEQVDMGRVTTYKLRVLIKKHWVMAETSNPQFVVARSATCIAAGATTAVIVGTIAPAARWFIALSKLVLLISICIATPIILCLNYVGRLRQQNRVHDSGSTTNSEADVRRYVVLLKGEVELLVGALENICKEVDEAIQTGKTKKPKHLLKLLLVVTLTNIALALPNVEKQKPEVAWQDKDIHGTSFRGKNDEDILHELSGKAEKTILAEFKRGARDSIMRNPLNWPPKVIAANSMYRMSRTILLTRRGENEELMEEELFELLFIMIADIMVACLTNLLQLITNKCSHEHNAIEEKETSVCEAALLLGETEEILQLLQQCEVPISDPVRAAYIEEWRASLSI